MSFSPLDNHEGESPIMNLPRVTMCLDKEFQEAQDAPKSGNMKVYARVRPMLQKEEDAGFKECIAAIDDETVRAIVPTTSVKFKNSGLNSQDTYDFKYTQAFGPDIGQFVFFEQTIMDTIQGFIEGQNCLIFNYGITNSGKTYTLQGNESNPGIIPLAMHLFFGCVESQLMDEVCVKPDKFSDILVLSESERTRGDHLKEELLRLVEHDSFNKTSASDTSAVTKSFSQVLCNCFRDDFNYQTETTLPPEEMIAAQSALYMRDLGKKSVDQQSGTCNIWVSFIEIYNEYIYDLLQPNVNQRQKLSLAEDQNGDVYVKGAREVCVTTSTEAIKLLYVGRKNLRIASTRLNYQSSRSHCIFTVKVARVFEDENGNSGRVNRISFCDLAGSERATKSQTSGIRLKEAGYINTSLMVLGRCLDQLRLNQTARDKKMIPFRESKLTRLFSNHFLGKGKAVMIANASPSDYTFDETLNVLRFSALAKDLAISDAYISMAQSSLLDICDQWHKSKNRISGVSPNESACLDSSFADELAERDEMIEKLVDVAESLKQNLEEEKKEKRELEYKIRQEVYVEYSAHSDELLDEQKTRYEAQIESLRDMYKQRYDAMKKMYEKKIQDLQAENESDDTFENSVSEVNKTFEKIEESLISFSPAVGQPPKEEVDEKVPVTMDTSMDFFDAAAEEDVESSPDIQSLKEDLESVTKELNITKKKLEETSKSLKESQTEEAIAKEKSDALNCKLLEANQVLEEYRKELEQLKNKCESCENDIDSFLEEKKNLQDNILSLSEQLAQATAEAEQLKKEIFETEESYLQKLVKSEKEIADMEERRRELDCKLKESLEALEEEEKKYIKLQEEYDVHINNTNTIIAGSSDLKEKLTVVSQQLELSNAEIECLKKEKLEIEEKYAQEKSSVIQEMTELENKCKELSMQLEQCTQELNEEKSKYSSLKVEIENYKNNYIKVSEDYKILEAKFTNVSEELELVSAEIELLKKEKLNAETDFSLEKAKLLDENSNVTEQNKNLRSSLGVATKDLEEQTMIISALESKIKNLESASEKSDVSELLEKLKNLEEKSALMSDELEKAKISKEKSKELGIELEKTTLVLEQEKTKGAEIASKCSTYATENAKLLEDLKNSEEKLKLQAERACISNEMVHEEQKSKINALELKIQELESSCSVYKSKNLELMDELKNMQEKLEKLYQQLEDSKSASERSTTLNLELESITEILKEEKSKVDELLSKCDSLEKENATLLEKVATREENSGSKNIDIGYTTEIEELTLKLEETNKLLENKELKIHQLEKQFSHLQSENADLLKTLDTEKEKFCKLSEEQASAISEVEHLQKEITEAVDVHSTALSELKIKETTAQEKCNKLIVKLEEASKVIEDQKFKIEEAEEKSLDYENKILGFSQELVSLKEEYSSFSEIYGKLLQVLEKCEMCATHKIKLLHSSSIKNLDELTDLKRQIREKETSIEELETALCDFQKQLKDSEARAKKQMHAIKQQHAIEIEEMAHLKKLAEEENSTLKSTIAEISKKEIEKEEIVKDLNGKEETVKDIKGKDESVVEIKMEEVTTKQISKVCKGRKKRSLSEVSKDETDTSLDKENSDRDSLKEKVAEEKTVSKRRRVLRQRQEIADCNASNSESEDECLKPRTKKKQADDDYKPVKANSKRRAPAKEKTQLTQKNTTAREPKVPATRTSRRKLQEDVENVSPVKKAMAFVGSKLRSVAQTVTSMPSPRITRGRKKLFNADAASPATRQWKF